jgi:hypothetical protein
MRIKALLPGVATRECPHRRHRIGLSGRTPDFFGLGVAGDADIVGDLVPVGRDVGVVDRPIQAFAIGAFDFEVVGQQARKVCEIMERGAAGAPSGLIDIAVRIFAFQQERRAGRLDTPAPDVIDRTERGAIEIRKRRLDVHDPRFEQCLLRRDRDLLIDKMSDAGVFSAGHQRFSHRVESGGLIRRQGMQRRALCARLAWRKHDFGAANRKGERADCRALHEGAPFYLVHGLFLPHSAGSRRMRENSTPKRNLNQAAEATSSRSHSASACWGLSSDPATGVDGAAGGGVRPNELMKARNFGLALSASRPAVTSMSI